MKDKDGAGNAANAGLTGTGVVSHAERQRFQDDLMAANAGSAFLLDQPLRHGAH
jgi:hypothetical protein